MGGQGSTGHKTQICTTRYVSANSKQLFSPHTPPDSYCIDYLFFVHDRHFGNREAMKQYLEWETGLIKQLDEQDKASFKVGEPT